MTLKYIFRAAVSLAAVVLWTACANPSSIESFVGIGNKSAGRYVFSADMSDSASVYDLSFYTRIDCGKETFASLGDIRTDVLFVSPSGKQYSETVYLRTSEFVTTDSLSWEFLHPYRVGIDPTERGTWTLSAYIPEDDSIAGFRGLGLVLRRH